MKDSAKARPLGFPIFDMRITFCGANREVTGSCYLVETNRTRLVVDAGMFQGSVFTEVKNFNPFPFDPSTVNAVVVTHAHLDHTGRLPKLVREGFRGKIYATAPTKDLAQLVLDDALQIMREEERRESRPALYGEQDVERTMQRFVSAEYSHSVKLDGLSFRLRDAGHIFGSAFVEVAENGGVKATFSGDIGNEHVPILRETAQLAETDVLVMESTYGNRVHEDESARAEKLRGIILKTIQRGGVLLIPAFAIERTQQLLYEMHHLAEHGSIPRVPVFLDSPMAIAASDVIKSYPQYYDQDALAEVSIGEDLFAFPGLQLTKTREESKTINAAPWPKIVIAGAGMMNGGRILHHLVRYLGDAKCTVLIIGYQASGTLGRRLYRGEKTVDVLGERIRVKAEVLGIGAYSAHGDQNKLVQWAGGAAKRPNQIYCTHGDEGASAALATRLMQETGIRADVPRYGDTIDL